MSTNALPVIHAAASRVFGALARLQLFAEVARIGYENALVASKVEPSKVLNLQLARYVNSQDEQFYDLYQNVAVRLWATLEAFVSDVAISVIEQLDWLKLPAGFPKVKVSLTDLLAIKGASRAEFILEQIEREQNASLKQGVGRFEQVLNCIGLGGPIDEGVRTCLFRLSKYRNCIVHQDGVIDNKFLKDLPDIGLVPGTTLGVTATEAREFLFAVFWYVLELERRATPTSDSRLATIVSEQEKYARWATDCDMPVTAIPFARIDLSFARGLPAGSKVVVLGPPETPKIDPPKEPPRGK